MAARLHAGTTRIQPARKIQTEHLLLRGAWSKGNGPKQLRVASDMAWDLKELRIYRIRTHASSGSRGAISSEHFAKDLQAATSSLESDHRRNLRNSSSQRNAESTL